MNAQDTNSRRIVITGIGIVSPIGIGVEEFSESLSAGRSGISPFECMNYSAAPGNFGGEIKDFNATTAKKVHLKKQRKSIKVMCREIQLGVASALQCLDHSQIDLETVDHQRFGVDFGANLMLSPPQVLADACSKCTHGEGKEAVFAFDEWGGTGLPAMEPLWLLRYLPNMPACHIGIAADARGPNNSVTLAEASGNLVMAEACRILERGAADIMITGTTGTRVHPVKTQHAQMWDELADPSGDPTKACRPFDSNRTGEVVGESACSFLIEEEAHAKARGATIFGTILGAGASCSIDADMNADRRKAVGMAIRAALRDANLSPSDIGHVNANAAGSRVHDQQEAEGIADVFGGESAVPVTALKGYFGNSGSGCGPLELAGSILSLRDGKIPKTLNCSTPDPDCPVNVVHGEHMATDNRLLLSVNVTRLGQASAVVLNVA